MPKVCRDIILVIYPLVHKKTHAKTGWYTKTNYDLYKYNKDKYVRGEPIFYAEDLTNKPYYYNDIKDAPKTIEDGNMVNWKCIYSNTVNTQPSNTLLNAYLSRELLKG